MTKTLFIINPHAGRAQKVWRVLERQLASWVDDYSVITTQSPDDIATALQQATDMTADRIISIGGDGTNKFMVNALMAHREAYPDFDCVFGCIPAGTGRDFARGVGLPLDSLKAAEYILMKAQPRPVDIGVATFDEQRHYFLNVSSAGIANDVVQRVERSPKRPWTFLWSVLSALVRYEPEHVQIELDGKMWFEGHIYVAGIANGKSIGQGILIAPDAIVDDGLFDVVVAEKMTTWQLMNAFPTIYVGKHISHPKVHSNRARHVRITLPKQASIGIDLDGEPATVYDDIEYEIAPSALRMLL
ncbi:MAG: diacylglycerol kinase family protein [Chloroflexota bacterium]